MDVDRPSPHPVADILSLFESSPEQFPWKEPRLHEIESRRSLMSDELFFDILLDLGGIDQPAALYPPKDVEALQLLLEAMNNATYDSMKRDCLVYYLLKWHGDGREAKYAEKKCISPHYVSIADAYWHLDTGVNLGRAIALFSDARIVKEYTSKVMETLSLSKEPAPLILKYVRTCKPALTEPEDLQKYFLAMAECNLMEAWQFQRTFPDGNATRRHLLHKLLEWTVIPQPRTLPLKQLLSIPLSEHEGSVIQDYAIHPPSTLSTSSVTVLRELVCVRLIQSCKYSEAVKFDRRYISPSSNVKGTWSSERKRIIGGILSVMPAAERAILDRDTERSAGETSQASKVTSSGSGSSWLNVSGSTDLAMSWEDVGPRQSNRSLGMAPRLNGSAENLITTIHGRPAPAPPRRDLGLSSLAHPPTLLNGATSRQSLFTPGASTSSMSRHPPLSTQPTLLVDSISQPTQSSSQLKFSTSAPSAASTSRPAPTRFGQLPTASTAVNTHTQHINGTTAPKSNALMTRNAFYNPPVTEQPPVNGKIHSPGSEDLSVEEWRPSQSKLPAQTEEQARSDNESVALETRTGIVEHDEQSSNGSEKEDLGFSLFGGAKRRTRATAAPRRSRSQSQQLMPPGAFVSEPEDSHTRHPRAKQGGQSSDAPRKRPSRKRPASPDEQHRQSLPGTLFEEDEEEERESDVPPLQFQPKRPARKGRSSRASSVDPGENEPSRPVRRSSRLSVTSSPTEAKSTSRPRKSTRTSGAGATATGRGAAKKR